MSDNSTDREAERIANEQQATDDNSFQFDSVNEDAENLDNADDDSVDVTLNHVRDVVTEEFDEEMWNVTEAILSAHATLLIEAVQSCTGLILVGDSGAGKTTAIRFLEGLNEQVYRSDEMTPASFVSHDSSRTEDELENVDLLPRIKHKSLTCRDMATWFSGEREAIYTRMSRMAHLMDGEGLTRDSGSHGQRGYEGDDYRFTVVGATTPLKPRAWEVMGHTGQRFVFHEKRSEDEDLNQVKEDLFGGKAYSKRVRTCRDEVHELLRELWAEHGGYKSLDDIGASDDAQEALVYLGNVVKFSRATLEKVGSGRYDPSREKIHRVATILYDIARGRALLDGRTEVEVEDVQVSARIALSTMPRKRRPLVRALLNPRNKGKLTAKQAENFLGVSRPTAIDRMREIDALDIADCNDTDERGTKCLELKPEFEWPDNLAFPDMGGA